MELCLFNWKSSSKMYPFPRDKLQSRRPHKSELLITQRLLIASSVPASRKAGLAPRHVSFWVTMLLSIGQSTAHTVGVLALYCFCLPRPRFTFSLLLFYAARLFVSLPLVLLGCRHLPSCQASTILPDSLRVRGYRAHFSPHHNYHQIYFIIIS